MEENTQNCWLFNNCNHKDCSKSFCLRRYKLDNLYVLALLSNSQKSKLSLKIDSDGTDLEAFKKLAEIDKNIVDFVEKGKNLYLHSSQCGNGKTSWSIRFIQSYLNKIWPKSSLTCRALFISVPRFLLAIKDNISEKSDYISYIKENILTADIVVFDDIAAKVGSDFEIQHLLNYIDNRISLGKTNIYTSNLSRKEMFNAVGERLTSRITNYSDEIELFGADKRNLAAKGEISND